MWPFSSDGWKQKLISYLAQSTIGKALVDPVDWETQVKLNNGQIILSDLKLDDKYLNTHLNPHGYRLRKGSIRQLTITVPWTGFLTESLSLSLDGLELELERTAATEIHQESSTSLSSSFHFAGNFIRTETKLEPTSFEEPISEEQRLSGITDLAQLINSIVGKVSLTLTNISVKIASETQNDAMILKLEKLCLVDHVNNHAEIPVQLQDTPDDLLSRFIKHVASYNLDVYLVKGNEEIRILRVASAATRLIFTPEPDVPGSDSSDSITISDVSISTVFEKLVVIVNPTAFSDVKAIFDSQANEHQNDGQSTFLTLEFQFNESIIAIIKDVDSGPSFQDFCSASSSVPPIYLASKPHLMMYSPKFRITLQTGLSHLGVCFSEMKFKEYTLSSGVGSYHEIISSLDDANILTIEIQTTKAVVFDVKDVSMSLAAVQVHVKHFDWKYWIPPALLKPSQIASTSEKQDIIKLKFKSSKIRIILDIMVSCFPVLELTDLDFEYTSHIKQDPEIRFIFNALFGFNVANLIDLKDVKIVYAGEIPAKKQGISERYCREKHLAMRVTEDLCTMIGKDWSQLEEDSVAKAATVAALDTTLFNVVFFNDLALSLEGRYPEFSCGF